MYSAVLMLALTGGNDAVEFGRDRCHGCTSCSYGCTTTVVSSCCCAPRQGLFHRSNGCSACSSSCHGGGLFHRNRCHGGNGCTTTCTAYTSCACSGAIMPPPPKMKEMPKGETVPPPKKTNAPATIVVSLPADARLFVDGAPTTSMSERRALVTPELEFGATYVYTVRAEIVRDGRTVEETQQVTVRSGEATPVRFDFATQTVASR